MSRRGRAAAEDPVAVDEAYDQGDGVGLVRTPITGRVLFLPAATVRRLDAEQLEVVADIQGDVFAINEAQGRLEQSVIVARDFGLSWDLIGTLTGLTGKGAQYRWGAAAEEPSPAPKKRSVATKKPPRRKRT